MTMGPPQAEEALREALGIGADRAILLSDRVFAVADTLGTSRTLALALRKEGFDLVLCGRKTVDSETWQVPPEVAAFLGVPHLTNATVARARACASCARRTRDEAVYELPLPAVVSVGACPDGRPRRHDRRGRDVDRAATSSTTSRRTTSASARRARRRASSRCAT